MLRRYECHASRLRFIVFCCMQLMMQMQVVLAMVALLCKQEADTLAAACYVAGPFHQNQTTWVRSLASITGVAQCLVQTGTLIMTGRKVRLTPCSTESSLILCLRDIIARMSSSSHRWKCGMAPAFTMLFTIARL